MDMTMATPKTKGPGRPEASEADFKVPISSFKGKPAFKTWFERLRKHSRFSSSVLIEMALVEYAERHGFAEHAPER